MLALRGSLRHRDALRGLARAALSTRAAGRVLEVLTAAEWEALVKDSPAVVAKFTAAWCPPCKVIAPVVDALAAAHPAISFASLDIDRPELAAVVTAHAVAAVPTFAAYRGGALAETFSGADRERLAAMVEALAP